MDDPKPGQMSVSQAGRLGGRKTAKLHGPEHFQRIGKMGGERIRQLMEQGRKAESESRDER